MWINLIILVCIQLQSCLSDEYDYRRSNYPNVAVGSKVHDGCTVRGDVTIGRGTVVHAGARILAEAGPIMIGDGNVIHENAIIANRYDNDNGQFPGGRAIVIGERNVINEKAIISNRLSSNHEYDRDYYGGQPVQRIGDGNVFGAGSICEARRVGNGNDIRAGAYIPRGAEVGDGCVIGHNQYQESRCLYRHNNY